MASAPLSYLHGASQVPLLGETIGRNLDRTVAAFGDRDALISVHQGVRQTYAEFHAAVSEIARGLLGLGVEPGDRVGIWSPNNAEWATLQYATAKVGAILVNVNPAYRTSELAYALRQSGSRRWCWRRASGRPTTWPCSTRSPASCPRSGGASCSGTRPRPGP